jgi:hypothetical protein
MTDNPSEPIPPPPVWTPHDGASVPPPLPESPAHGTFPDPALSLEPLNPWFAIWFMPRAVMRQILDSNPRRMVHILAMLGGILEGIASRIPDLGFAVPLAGMVAFKVVVGLLAGLIILYVGSFLFWMTGKWLGGKGDFTAVRAAFAWSNNIPAVWGSMLLLPLLAYLGPEALNLDPKALLEDPVGLLLLLPIGFLGLVLFVWRFVILFKCVGEAHRFGAWSAFGAFLISCVLIVIPIAILAGVALAMLGLGSLAGLSHLGS